jgi:prevent-host-death family protein
MKLVKATEFKAGCLALLEQVARTGEPITVTKRGRPIAQVIPAVPTNARFPQEALRGTVEILGDIVSPVLPSDAWESERH